MGGIFSLRAFWEPSQGRRASEALCLTQTWRCTGSTTMLRGVTCAHHNMSTFRQSCKHCAHCADRMLKATSHP